MVMDSIRFDLSASNRKFGKEPQPRVNFQILGFKMEDLFRYHPLFLNVHHLSTALYNILFLFTLYSHPRFSASYDESRQFYLFRGRSSLWS